ncbi:Alpha,alpha-trehalose-phosphate synthase [Rhodovulum sp. P5]|uniref:HAD family hydrolase n=1 Tax=Rhodovulum sp. P5 TaxID=1564506 RepID=UPI0009C37079|nr:HAD family hydrolase [Rhodovulum sp. P5]ARE40540.1 Alpha,alpha-trehalose-phosphate synthase [Rhodovulum sp. P5]
MNIQTKLLPPLSDRQFVLATDLDGTFLGGAEADRRTLYNWIEDNRVSIGLIFVTGRDPDFIMELCSQRGLPWPDYVVGDVGTTIAEVVPRHAITPIPALEADISDRWGDKGDAVRETLDGHPGLSLQPTAFRHRVSFDLDAGTYCATAEDKIERLGLDWLISDKRFFDVLPKGVSKGPSLKRLIAHLGIPQARVLAAGDTLNDLSMLECGLNAVAVGNSESALLDRLRGLDHVYTARAHGAAGIMEAINAFALHDNPTGA